MHSMIAGSLLAIVGYQVASLGVFATKASDPIKKPSDPVTRWLSESVSLERGAMAGAAVFAIGSVYAGVLVWQWISSGFGSVAFTMGSLVAFTAIVIGLQTVFSSFFLGSVKA